MKTIDTKLGKIDIPNLINWPNQGVGRINPDGSSGACTACHPRHGFLIEVARKPYTCSQCHHEPDAPAWNVYEESKHGNIYLSKGNTWNFTNVPWKAGEDFKAPTCAACHNSLIVSPDNTVIAERSHNFGSRLWVRLFGLIYNHAQPKSGDTTIIKNKDALPLPVTFTGEPASEYLIDQSEQENRLQTMSRVCNTCHGIDWINGHFAKLGNTLKDLLPLLSVPLLYVPGNHDPNYQPENSLAHVEGGSNLDLKVTRQHKFLIGGFGGCIRYRPDGTNQYTQTEAYLRALRLLPRLWLNRLNYGRALDILITHSPPFGIHDEDSEAHQGLKAINWLLRVAKPRYHFHGHTHFHRRNLAPSETSLGITKIVNIYPYKVLEVSH